MFGELKEVDFKTDAIETKPNKFSNISDEAKDREYLRVCSHLVRTQRLLKIATNELVKNHNCMPSYNFKNSTLFDIFENYYK